MKRVKNGKAVGPEDITADMEMSSREGSGLFAI